MSYPLVISCPVSSGMVFNLQLSLLGPPCRSPRHHLATKLTPFGTPGCWGIAPVTPVPQYTCFHYARFTMQMQTAKFWPSACMHLCLSSSPSAPSRALDSSYAGSYAPWLAVAMCKPNPQLGSQQHVSLKPNALAHACACRPVVVSRYPNPAASAITTTSHTIIFGLYFRFSVAMSHISTVHHISHKGLLGSVNTILSIPTIYCLSHYC
ncbi:unnamed protein product [Protopolystoma xenopodis]|uniref:Uncharacterized protein n=1 Tax=Protopolystoma xenopodis TaxID=117903 RepID=A0A448WIZ8_9PLAT|nr:unnamed protein product [Protopolystoma xenopodis]